MAGLTTSTTDVEPESRGGAMREIRAFWRQFFVQAFGPYRPELHYMRGPGPAWHAKHGPTPAQDD
jgi:hypothetical protein